jgi:hypothetical protein
MYAYLAHLKNHDPAFYSEKPKTFWVKDRNATLLQVNIETIEKRHRFQWIEDVIVSDEQIKQLPANIAIKLQVTAPLESADLPRIVHYLENINIYYDKIALIDMDELGFGTIALEDFKNLNGNILTFYAGEVNVLPYSPSYDLYTLIGDFPCVIDSQRVGNISRFMPHLPHPHELDSLDLSEKDRNRIATVNVTKKPIKIGYKEIIIFCFEKDILAGEIIGFSYGRSFWSLKDYSFWLFLKNGEKFAKVKYSKEGELILC